MAATSRTGPPSLGEGIKWLKWNKRFVKMSIIDLIFVVRYSQLLVRLRTQLLEVVMGDRQWLHLVGYILTL